MEAGGSSSSHLLPLLCDTPWLRIPDRIRRIFLSVVCYYGRFATTMATFSIMFQRPFTTDKRPVVRVLVRGKSAAALTRRHSWVVNGLVLVMSSVKAR